MPPPGHLVKRETRNSLTRARNPAENKSFLRILPNPLTFFITRHNTKRIAENNLKGEPAMTSGSHSETTYTSPIRRATALAVACGYLLTLLPAAHAAPAGGCPAPLPPPSLADRANPDDIATSRAVISAESGGEVRLGRASIKIPAGALAEDTEISITRLGRVRDTGEGLDNATERGGGYRFLPAGQQFLKYVFCRL